MIVPVVKNKNNGFAVATVHYSLDPDKNNPKWIAEAKKGMPETGFRREYEIDYSFFAGKPFFPEFNQYNIAKVKYKPRETLYRGWDYGFHRPCCLITKLNQFDQWGWMRVIMGKDEGIKEFGLRTRDFCTSEYPGAKYIDVDDIAGKQVSDKSQQTSRQILNAIGIYPRGRKQEIEQGVQIIRQKLGLRVDGKPGLIVDPTQTDIIDGFKGGIHYPEVKEGKPQKEQYEKEGYYEHIFDIARYLAVDMFTVIGQTQDSNQIVDNNARHKFADGRVRESSVNEITEDNELKELLGPLV